MAWCLAVRREWRGAVELDVTTGEGTIRALAYPELTGRPEAGDRVLLNTSALDARPGHRRVRAGGGGARPAARRPGGPGHLVKARYTPMQATVLGADEQDSPHHDVLRDADDLGGMPVVVADLHSALPAVLAGAARRRPARRRAVRVYVMTDGGALPAWFSRTCAGLREAGWLAGTVTVGQAFGGDLEAVTLHAGLLAARHVLGADVAVVAQGPGNLGTGTRWGFSGVAAGEAVNAAAVLGGRPVAVAAGQRRRSAGAAPRRVPPQPDRLRPGRAGPGRRGACPTCPASSARRVAAQAAALASGTGWSRVSDRGPGRARCAAARCRCPRWAAGWTRTRRTSWPPPRPGGTPRPAGQCTIRATGTPRGGKGATGYPPRSRNRRWPGHLPRSCRGQRDNRERGAGRTRYPDQ